VHVPVSGSGLFVAARRAPAAQTLFQRFFGVNIRNYFRRIRSAGIAPATDNPAGFISHIYLIRKNKYKYRREILASPAFLPETSSPVQILIIQYMD